MQFPRLTAFATNIIANEAGVVVVGGTTTATGATIVSRVASPATKGGAGSAILDTNAVIAAVERGEAATVLAGRIPLIPITAVKEFLRGGGSIEALRSFLVANGGRVALAGEEAVAANLRTQAAQMGRVLHTADSRIAASAVREGVPIVTEDRRFANFLRAAGIPVGGFR